MAENLDKTVQSVAVYEAELQSVLPLDNPDAIVDLGVTNCFCSEWLELRALISRFAGLRRLRCVACAIEPSQLLLLTLERLPNLEELELSLVQEAVVDSEISKVRGTASQKQGVALAQSLRRLYVEVGGDRNFELLRELLNFYLNLTELHVHLVRGSFPNSLSQCRRLREELVKLERFAFTSELPVSVPFPNEMDPPSAFANRASICGNVRHRRSDDWWSCVELNHLAYGSCRALTLPSQLAVVAVSAADDTLAESFRLAGRRNVWVHVRQLCLLMLPPVASIEFYPTTAAASRGCLGQFFSVALEHVVELNLNSFHFRSDLDLIKLLPKGTLRRLQALSAPPCGFPSQSAVRRLPTRCPNLRELDVRIDTRGGQFRCGSCELLQLNAIPSKARVPSVVHSGIARLTVCHVPAHVLLWYAKCCPAAVTVRLADWPGDAGGLKYDFLAPLTGGNSPVRCLVLRHKYLPIRDPHLQASLARLTNLQHLCLLTSARVTYAGAWKFVLDVTARMRQLKCLHLHYVCDTERRVTWVRGRQYGGAPFRDSPCFACCSTATFIGLVKPVNRDCETVPPP
ncbi:uncharacterized protein LOC119400010 isoform X2 [Rhipicephalus sanguineus]|uniref:Uncharacterized protein n=1 Tax=Rhipicephalus sanguineus TaxID=34632 RepID=A0A9D4PHZ0_RHISA|nr:uncharacterized protein LOC119400010 isoform X2 [Rhipicephalus sanguineus]KAH7943159.1 hypothetical protein HPB52_005948 [Rhipicephalus sanguineus]